MDFLDLKRKQSVIRAEALQAIERVMDNTAFIGGEEVEALEEEVARFCDVKYAVGVNSGTDALYLSLRALGIGPGDEVITTPFTFFATAESIANTGAAPVFADIDPETFNINPEEALKKINKKTKAILPVHLFGRMADMEGIIKISEAHNLFVVEDSAQAFGSSFNGRFAGSFGNLGALSFFPSKNLSGFGDGGMVVTNKQDLAERIRSLRSHGSSCEDKYLNMELGVNSRLDALQAAVLRVKLKYVSEWNKEREEAALYYNRNLKGVCLPQLVEGHTFNQYTMRCPYREKLAEELKKKGIPSMVYYRLPLHLQPAFKYLGYKKGDFPEAEKAAEEVLSLPIYPCLQKEDQDKIIKEINSFTHEEI